MEVRKMIFLFNHVIFRFHVVSFRGCNHCFVLILLMLQKSGKLTSWGGSFISLLNRRVLKHQSQLGGFISDFSSKFRGAKDIRKPMKNIIWWNGAFSIIFPPKCWKFQWHSPHFLILSSQKLAKKNWFRSIGWHIVNIYIYIYLEPNWSTSNF